MNAEFIEALRAIEQERGIIYEMGKISTENSH